MSTRERLHEPIEDLTDEQAAILADYAERLLDDDEEEMFTEEEIDEILRIEAEVLAGNTVKWEEIERRLGLDLTA